MSIDIYHRSSQLLQKLANSIAERKPECHEFCFSVAEIHVVESWLKELLSEALEDILSNKARRGDSANLGKTETR